ncbi:MAG: M28 family peptidase [Coriobacteriales bacterium]|nr:M28 family peptidase [Coriobacteriales bacterium]
MAELMQHVHALADQIGPRPTTTDAEHNAALYIESVLQSHGLETELQEFDAPRQYAWAYVVYHLLTIASAVLAGIKMWPWAVWPAFAVSAITAFVMWMDLDTRWGLSSIMPKGPTQNVIGRIEPKSRRGERVRKVVVVAHYDSARSSLAFAPSMVRGFPVTFGLMKWTTILVPVLVLVMALPFSAPAQPWLWYATMAVAAYLLIPLFINAFGAIAGRWVDGANDNASGVAAMLGIVSHLAPLPEETLGTASLKPVIHTPEEAFEADVVPEGAVLSYSPAGGNEGEALPDDFEWAEPASTRTSRDQGVLEFDTIDFAAVGDDAQPRRRRGASAEDRTHVDGWGEPAEEDEDAAWNSFAASAGDLAPRPVEEPKKKGGLFGRFGKKKEEPEDVRGWLGVDEDFDARKTGAEIGTWDQFGGEEEDEDDWGWKGGRAGEDPLGDPEYTTDVVARIRRKLEDAPDRDYSDKEVWFVATGAEESGTWGMRAFLDDYGPDVRDAFIINIDNVGAGSLYWITAEGMARKYRSDRRLTSLAKRVSREQEILVKPRVYNGLSTDATPALARGYKAMSVMAFGAGGEIEGWHWPSDTASRIQPELLERTATFVAEMIKEA